MKGGIGPFHFSRTLPLNIFLQSRTYVILSIESILVKYTLRSVKIPLSLKEPATVNQMLCKLERVLFVIVLGGLRVMLRTIFLQCRQTDKQTSKIYIYIYKRCDVVLFYSAWNKKMQEKDYSCRFGPKSRCRTNLHCNNELPWSVSFPPPELGRLAPSGLQLYLASGSEEISEAVLSPYIKNYLLIVLN